jgi:hypothetical protein
MKLADLKNEALQYIQKGIDAKEAQSIYDTVVPTTWDNNNNSVYKVTQTAKADLVKLSELYGRFFTSSGVRAWAKLTGIDVAKPESIKYPTAFLSAGRLNVIRAAVAKDKKGLSSIKATRGPSGVKFAAKHTPAAATIKMFRALEAKAKKKQMWVGWWKVSQAGKGWSFSNLQLAARCYELLAQQGGGRVKAEARIRQPDQSYRSAFNPTGPFYT